MIEVAAICEMCHDDFAHGDDREQVRELVGERGGFVDSNDFCWCADCSQRMGKVDSAP